MVQESGISSDAVPTIVFIPASFTPAFFYTKVIDRLREDGLEVNIHDLPSASRRPPESAATLADDAAYFQHVAETFADQGKDVVFVMHSYGGIVGTEASRGLTKREREAAGKKGGLVRFLYISSVIATPGKSLNDMLESPGSQNTQVAKGAHLAKTGVNNDQGEYMRNEPFEDCARAQFSDLPLEEGIEWVKKMTLQSAPSFANKLTYPGYKYVPAAWILCENDRILSAETQQKYIEIIEEASGNKVDVHRVPAGHFPNASIPAETANAIIAAVRVESSGARSAVEAFCS